jgi:dUTP pyrophosphatase
VSAAESGASDLAVLFRRLHPAAQVPRYAHPGDAGADLCCCEPFTLEPGERRLVGTGLAIALPEGYAAFVHPRSGLAARFGITVVNAPGTVDAGYRGEIQVCLLNTDRSGTVSFAAGDRIAQLVVQQVARVTFTGVDALPDSDRGIGGHGSTGGILGR